MHHQFLKWTDKQIQVLYPGCFAFVMATGIISNALFAEHFRAFSDLSFAATALAYLWLIALSILRAVRFPNALRSDLLNPLCVFSFFTLVAASNVLGAAIYLRGFAELAFYLWLFALAIWFVLFYFSFSVWIFLNGGSGTAVLQGGWLLAIVATESLAILGTIVASRAGSSAAALVVLSHMLWGVGLTLYAIYVALFIYRILFFAIGPDDLSPALWVVMGAAAITTNAGCVLIEAAGELPYLENMRPFLDGTTLIVWAWATVWIPLLILMGIWKHVILRAPLAYSPLLWSIVFPLGMYSIATLRFASASDFSSLRAVSSVMLCMAVAAWLASLAALALASWHSFREFGRPSTAATTG